MRKLPVIALLLFAACQYRPGAQTRQNRQSGGQNGLTCAQLTSQIQALVSQLNGCTSHSDCLLLDSEDTQYFACKGIGVNRQANLTQLNALFSQWYQGRCGEGLACTMDYRWDTTPCNSGRCASDVNSYEAP